MFKSITNKQKNHTLEIHTVQIFYYTIVDNVLSNCCRNWANSSSFVKINKLCSTELESFHLITSLSQVDTSLAFTLDAISKREN